MRSKNDRKKKRFLIQYFVENENDKVIHNEETGQAGKMTQPTLMRCPLTSFFLQTMMFATLVHWFYIVAMNLTKAQTIIRYV